MAVDPEVWEKQGDGVEFQIELKHDLRQQFLITHFVDPKRNPEQRKWNELSIDLSPFGGKEVQIILRTLPGASPDFDWAGWGHLVIMRRQ